MGNSNSDSITDAVNSIKDEKTDFKVGRAKNSVLGNVTTWTHKKTGQVSLVRGKIMDEELGASQARLKFLIKGKKNCIPLLGISKVESSQGWCAAVIYELRIPSFEVSLHDLLVQGFVRSEADLWSIIIGITRVASAYKALAEYEVAKIDHGYVCGKSIIFLEGNYHLMDCMFYDMNHFQLAKLSLRDHLCSPEAFNQITTRFRSPVLQSTARSDLFSLDNQVELSSMYNSHELSVADGLLDHAIKSIADSQPSSSNLIQAVLKDMLLTDELLRPSPSHLAPFFTKFEVQLRSGKVSSEAVVWHDLDAIIFEFFR